MTTVPAAAAAAAASTTIALAVALAVDLTFAGGRRGRRTGEAVPVALRHGVETSAPWMKPALAPAVAEDELASRTADRARVGAALALPAIRAGVVGGRPAAA